MFVQSCSVLSFSVFNVCLVKILIKNRLKMSALVLWKDLARSCLKRLSLPNTVTCNLNKAWFTWQDIYASLVPHFAPSDNPDNQDGS